MASKVIWFVWVSLLLKLAALVLANGLSSNPFFSSDTESSLSDDLEAVPVIEAYKEVFALEKDPLDDALLDRLAAASAKYSHDVLGKADKTTEMGMYAIKSGKLLDKTIIRLTRLIFESTALRHRSIPADLLQLLFIRHEDVLAFFVEAVEMIVRDAGTNEVLGDFFATEELLSMTKALIRAVDERLDGEDGCLKNLYTFGKLGNSLGFLDQSENINNSMNGQNDNNNAGNVASGARTLTNGEMHELNQVSALPGDVQAAKCPPGGLSEQQHPASAGDNKALEACRSGQHDIAKAALPPKKTSASGNLDGAPISSSNNDSVRESSSYSEDARRRLSGYEADQSETVIRAGKTPKNSLAVVEKASKRALEHILHLFGYIWNAESFDCNGGIVVTVADAQKARAAFQYVRAAFPQFQQGNSIISEVSVAENCWWLGRESPFWNQCLSGGMNLLTVNNNPTAVPLPAKAA